MKKELEVVKKRKINRDISWEELEEKLNKVNNKFQRYYGIIFYILIVSIILFTFARVIKNETNYYSNELKMRFGTVLSYDDVYSARIIYSGNQNYEEFIGTVVKHPFMFAFGEMVSNIENSLFKNTESTDHYFHIVVLQIFINAIGMFYLYRILKEQYGIKDKWCFLLLTIYQLATVTLLGTLIIDSFIISSTLLIMSYYYLSKQKLIISGILGILVTGFCITNSIAFAIMAIFLLKRKRDILKVAILCITGFTLATLLLPYKEQFWGNMFSEVINQANTFKLEEDTVSGYLKRVFYYLLCSPIFFLQMLHETNQSDMQVLSFDLSANLGVIAIFIVFLIIILFNLIKNIKDRHMLAAFGVFVHNMFLHAIMKYGLTEATLFGLHFLFAEILMFAFGFKIKNAVIRRTFILLALLLLAVQVKTNINGLLSIMLIFKDWS